MSGRTRLAVVCFFVHLATPSGVSTSVSAQGNEWIYCSSEGGVCAFTGTMEVRYGANGSYVYKTLTDGTACTNSVFGDPAAGTPKECAIKRSTTTATASTTSTSTTTSMDWTVCAGEGGTCAFTGTREVR